MESSSSRFHPSTQQPNVCGAASQQRASHARQLLSCTKCRDRKVKCDRTKPCSACCARGAPRECKFVVDEGNDYVPIQQSYEIRELRAENERLKKELQAATNRPAAKKGTEWSHSGRKAARGPSARKGHAQQRCRGAGDANNLYFGTPSLANIISDFASLRAGNHSLTHIVPTGRELYSQSWKIYSESHYPFPIVLGWQSIDDLVKCLPGNDEVFRGLSVFQQRAGLCYSPHTPDEISFHEVEAFLTDAARNAVRTPETLALIFAVLAASLQLRQMDYEEEAAGGVESLPNKTRRGDVFVTMSMQCLRIASFMSRPTLSIIQALGIMGPYLSNSGRFLDAWTLFGTTIRLAHSLGLHRNPKFLDPVPSMRECAARQNLWWWMLHMDQQYSATLGRPMGISGTGDCPPPVPLTTNSTMLRLSEFIDQFTLIARHILGSDGMTNISKIDEFTDRLIDLWETMPVVLQFNDSWMHDDAQPLEWPLEVTSAAMFVKIQSFLILLNRQRCEDISHATKCSQLNSNKSHTRSSTFSPSNRPFTTSRRLAEEIVLRGRPMVIKASVDILKAFTFFHLRIPAALICWTLCQQAFNACMILILDSQDTGDDQHEWLARGALQIFVAIHEKGVHQLAEAAIQMIDDGLAVVEKRRRERGQRDLQRRQSFHAQYEPSQGMLGPDASGAHWVEAGIMGGTGMLLPEGSRLQGPGPPPFQPLQWNMATEIDWERL